MPMLLLLILFFLLFLQQQQQQQDHGHKNNPMLGMPLLVHTDTATRRVPDTPQLRGCTDMRNCWRTQCQVFFMVLVSLCVIC
jgi:hypothetical protein